MLKNNISLQLPNYTQLISSNSLPSLIQNFGIKCEKDLNGLDSITSAAMRAATLSWLQQYQQQQQKNGLLNKFDEVLPSIIGNSSNLFSSLPFSLNNLVTQFSSKNLNLSTLNNESKKSFLINNSSDNKITQNILTNSTSSTILNTNNNNDNNFNAPTIWKSSNYLLKSSKSNMFCMNFIF